ncbi:hypothetical protein [Cloacibacillus sp. An23]|uniref:hypothetical protein n=1 Tax=Cloacibacillus sp. An23 TaxID=1965591 RepID=UPI001177ADE8|nr:hypothetical protein [Cloacibacillus sp. An23]
MSDVMTYSKRTASGLEEALRTVLLDADNKVPAEALRIVGAISDGAIIEQGSNANGDWVRYANGTQICTGSVTISFVSTDSYVASTATFPAVFISPPVVVSGTYQGAGNGSASDAAPPNATSCLICVSPTRGITFGSDSTREYTYIAIGKWK